MAVRYGRAVGRSVLVGCLVPAVCLGWLAFLAVGFGFLFPHLPRDAKQMIVPIALLTWIFTLLPALGLFAVAAVVRRNRALDRAFARYGPGRALAPVARAWAGTVGGRAFNAWFSKGPRLELYLGCSPGTEGGIGRDNALARFAAGITSREPVDLGGGLTAYGADAAWMRAFATDPRSRAAFATLLDDRAEGYTNIVIQPDAVKYSAHYLDMADLTATRIEALVGHLAALAAVADSVPPPARRLEATGMVARMRTNRGSLGGMLAVSFGITAVLMVFSVVTALVIVFATGG